MKTLFLLSMLTACDTKDTSDDTGSSETQDDTEAYDGEVNTDPTVFPDADAYAAVLEAANWGSDVTVTVDGDTLTISSSGLPDHEYLEAYTTPNGGTVGVIEYDMSFTISLSPQYTDSTQATDLGTIGAAISGGVFFNPYEGNGDIALDNNFEVDGIPFLDSCNGHPLPSEDTYHYHGNPYCITDVYDTAGEHSVLIGVLADGFPVYGLSDVDGEPPTDLDACSGHTGATPEFPEGVYHYHFTEGAPYSFDCYHGEI